jgi:uncharacterized protein YndB with AHSA1/START domain
MEAAVAVQEGAKSPYQVITRGLPDELVTSTFILEEVQGGTQVTVTMSGFESLPEDSRQDHLAPSGAAWEKALENLKAYLAGAELPFPEGYVAALFGYRRESKKIFGVERSIWIDASRERVWKAITDPEQIEQWFSPGTKWRTTETEAGTQLSVYDPESDSDMYIQIVELVEPPYRLITRTNPEPPEAIHTTTWSLEEENGGTRLLLTYTGYEQEPEETRHPNIEQNAFGFGMMLENLKANIEGANLPYPGGF